MEAVQRAPRSPQRHRHQTNKNNKTHKIKINKNKKFKRTRDVAAGATTRMLTRMRSLIFLLICTKNLLAHWTVAQTCPSGADCTGSVSTWDVARVTDMNRSECLCLLAHGPHLHQQAVACRFNIADNPFLSFPLFLHVCCFRCTCSVFAYASINQALGEWDRPWRPNQDRSRRQGN